MCNRIFLCYSVMEDIDFTSNSSEDGYIDRKPSSEEWIELKNKLEAKSKFVDGHQVWIGKKQINGILPKMRFAGEQRSVRSLAFFLRDEIIHPTSVRIVGACNEKFCILPEHSKKLSDSTLVNEPTNEDYANLSDRLLQKVERHGECLLWVNGLDVNGYGTNQKFFGKNYAPHILSWIAANKSFVPSGKMICHKCKNKSCIESEHLYAGTSLQNANDKKKDGTQPFGETHSGSKITEETAIAIKDSKGLGTLKERAKKFGTTVSIVESIDTGRTWIHLEKDSKRKAEFQKRNDEVREKKRQKPTTEPTKELYQETLVRIEKNCTIVKDGNTVHWITNLAKNSDGYSQTSFQGKQIFTHQLALECKLMEKKPKGLVTRHKCKEKSCCNPDCLEFGTMKENSKDKNRDGTDSRGEKHHNASVTNKIAKQIREYDRKVSHVECSKIFGVSYGVVQKIRNGKTYVE